MCRRRSVAVPRPPTPCMGRGGTWPCPGSPQKRRSFARHGNIGEAHCSEGRQAAPSLSCNKMAPAWIGTASPGARTTAPTRRLVTRRARFRAIRRSRLRFSHHRVEHEPGRATGLAFAQPIEGLRRKASWAGGIELKAGLRGMFAAWGQTPSNQGSNRMTMPGFTAEASLHGPTGYRMRTNDQAAVLPVVPAAASCTPCYAYRVGPYTFRGNRYCCNRVCSPFGGCQNVCWVESCNPFPDTGILV
jgi:hypothetical protein